MSRRPIDPPIAKCIKCQGKTRHRNADKQPWCACCQLDVQRKDPRDAGWMPCAITIEEPPDLEEDDA